MALQPDVHYLFATYFDSTQQLSPYLYTLSRSIYEGHICINIKDDLPADVLEIFHLTQQPSFPVHPLIGGPEDITCPFILDNSLLYTQRLYQYEVHIADFIKQATSGNSTVTVAPSALRVLLEQYFPVTTEPASDWQLIATLSALFHNFTIITGGPGTGKTTTVSRILSILWQLHPSLKIALAAPTGKAAARMAESLHHSGTQKTPELAEKFRALPSGTLHRMLGPLHNSIYFKYNRTNPLPYDVIVVDECSMIDIALFSKLLSAVPPHCKLILLGDKNQLASVEAGSLFGDICNTLPAQNIFSPAFLSEVAPLLASRHNRLPEESSTETLHLLTDHIVTLEKSHRFRDDTGIGLISKAIIQNDTELLQFFCDMRGNDAVQIDFDYTEERFREFVHYFSAYIFDSTGRKQDIHTALKAFGHCRILSAVKQQETGIYNLNLKVEQYLHQRGWINMHDPYYDYRPIMITRNNYALGLHNGDTGILKKDIADGITYAYFLVVDEYGTEQVKKILPGLLPSYETCYAMTIHKSQGSEFDKVLMILPPQEDSLIVSRELIYTGITRAKQQVLIQSSKHVFLEGCNRKVSRHSGLQYRLQYPPFPI